jgi:hypothetical protein
MHTFSAVRNWLFFSLASHTAPNAPLPSVAPISKSDKHHSRVTDDDDDDVKPLGLLLLLLLAVVCAL